MTTSSISADCRRWVRWNTACPQCRADAGHECRTKTRKRARRFHRKRHIIYRALVFRASATGAFDD